MKALMSGFLDLLCLIGVVSLALFLM